MTDAEQIVLGWTRDEKGNVTDRHPVEVANTVTSSNRDNTQNYVMEQIFLNGDKDGCASTLTTGKDFSGNIVNPKGGHKQMGVMEVYADESQVMTPKRTEYGKQIRKKYEAGEVKEQRKHIHQLEPRPDGICNTLTSVQKDNLLFEPVNDQDGVSRTIKAQYQQSSAANFVRSDAFGATGVRYGVRIRKLTERECFRLMDVPEEYIDRIQESGVSRSQQYKMAGNSIVVACMYHIFDKLFINTTITEPTLF